MVESLGLVRGRCSYFPEEKRVVFLANPNQPYVPCHEKI